MVLHCQKCGARNRVPSLAIGELPRCETCSELLDCDAVEAARDGGIQWRWVLLCLAICLVALIFVRQSLESEARDRANELVRRHNAELQAPASIASAPVSTNALVLPRSTSPDPKLAKSLRAQEWKLRQQRDPAFARSLGESNLLRLTELSSNRQIADWQYLHELLKLVTPPGSRIEVLPEGDGFAVRVAFKISALVRGEDGWLTHHTSMSSLRQQTRVLAAEVIRDVCTHAGHRRIVRLSVAANRAMRHNLIPEEATEEERRHLSARESLRMVALYRLSLTEKELRTVVDWSALTVRQVLEKVALESDGTLHSAIRFVTAEDVPPREGSMEDLEF